MDYGKKYYWEGTRHDGTTEVKTILVIEQRDYAGIQHEIGDLAGLSLGFEGNNEAYSPIIKSTLTIDLIDSYDTPQTPLVADSVKYGAWEEFYTPDATLYRVLLYEKVGSANQVLRWRGFVTPDSWEEDLIYHGHVTINARDNIGHLADFAFEAPDTTLSNGLISVQDLVSAAANKIGQTFNWDNATALTNAFYTNYEDTRLSCYLPSILVDTAAFKDKDWYDVLEGVLDSLGLCLRWQDKPDVFVISAIYRNQWAQSSAGVYSHAEKSIIFLNKSGHRVLQPCLKSITDNISYETREDKALEPSGYTRLNIGTIDAYYLDDDIWKTYFHQGANFIRTLDPKRTPYAGRKEWRTDDSLMIRASYNSGNDYFYRSFLCPTLSTINLSWDTNKGLYRILEGETSTSIGFNNYGFRVNVEMVWHRYDNGADMWYVYNASTDSWYWQTTRASVPSDYTGEDGGWNNSESKTIIIHTPTEVGYLEIRFLSIVALNAPHSSGTELCFARLFNIHVTPNTDNIYKSNKVITQYNSLHNVEMSRSPMLSQYPSRILAGVVNNIFYAPAQRSGYPSIESWQFDMSPHIYDFTTLAEMIHKQLLCLQGAPMSEFSGELTQGDALPHFNNVWTLADKKCYLTGGTLDLLTGRIQSSYLAEYQEWEDVWEE